MTAVLAHGFEANLSNRRLTLANLQGRSIEYVDSADHALDQGPATSRLPRPVAGTAHSHSMVPGGLLVTSRVTRLTSGTSLVIRVEMRASTS